MGTAQCPCRCMGVPLDTGYLDQAGHWIAGQPQMMLQTHLSRILDLGKTSPQELSRSGRSHGARRPHLTLTADKASGNGTVCLDHQAEKTGRGKGAEDGIPPAVQCLSQIIGTIPQI